MVWLLDGEWHFWVDGETNDDLFKQHFKSSRSLVTFNGKRFDEKFVCKKFKLKPHNRHFDLIVLCKKKNLKGGLKKISSDLDIYRPESINNIAGTDAIDLWNLYKKSNDKKDIVISFE